MHDGMLTLRISAKVTASGRSWKKICRGRNFSGENAYYTPKYAFLTSSFANRFDAVSARVMRPVSIT